jgi:hypothetical protein
MGRLLGVEKIPALFPLHATGKRTGPDEIRPAARSTGLSMG